MKYPLSRNFYVRTCVKFAFANKIKAMYERPHVQLCKRKSRNSLNLTFNLNTLYLNTSILFTLLKFTCVNVRSQKRVSGNLTLRMCHGRVYTGSFALNYPRTLLAAPPPPGWGVLPHMGYIGMCRCEGYSFQFTLG